MRRSAQHHVAAAAAVAAVGATERHQRLTPERRRAVATLARTHEHVNLIDECLVLHRQQYSISGRVRSSADGAEGDAASEAVVRRRPQARGHRLCLTDEVRQRNLANPMRPQIAHPTPIGLEGVDRPASAACPSATTLRALRDGFAHPPSAFCSRTSAATAESSARGATVGSFASTVTAKACT